MKKTLLVVGMLFLALLLRVDILVQASTSSALSQETLDYYNYQKYSNNYEAPFARVNHDNINIDEMTGGISLRETDLSLPGKNGMDINITRMYSNQDSGYEVVSLSEEESSTYHGYPYVYGSNSHIMVYFDEEEYYDNIPETFEAYIKPTLYSGYKYQNYDMLIRADPTLQKTTLRRESMEKDVRTVTSRYTHLDMGDKKIGNGFKLAWPKLVISGHRDPNYDKYKGSSSGMFENENGETFKFWSKKVYRDDPNNPNNLRMVSFTGTSSTMYRYKIDRLVDREESYKGIKYTAKVTDLDGKAYYFNQQDGTRVADIQMIEDIYGNTIKYEYDAGNVIITDTFGRKIKINTENKYTISGNHYGDAYTNMETRVIVEDGTNKQEIIYKTSVDSNNNNKIYDDKYIFEVRKKEYYNNMSADTSQYITRYETSRKQTTLHKVDASNTVGVKSSIENRYLPELGIRGKDIYNMEKIIYPTGAVSVFEYSDDMKLHELCDINNFTYYTNTFKVTSSKDKKSDSSNNSNSIRNEYSYSYQNQSDFTMANWFPQTRNITKINNSEMTSKTVNFNGTDSGSGTEFNIRTTDKKNKILDDRNYIQNQTGMKYREYVNTYNSDSKLSKTNEYITFYDNTRANIPTYSKNGNHEVEYRYANTFPDSDISWTSLGSYVGIRGFVSFTPEKTKYKKDENTTIEILNTFGTKEGSEIEKILINSGIPEVAAYEYYPEEAKYIVRTSVYENDVEVARTNYSYDDYGNVKSEIIKVSDNDEDIYRYYNYVYNSIGELTITSGVIDVEHILFNGGEPGGEQETISTTQKCDFLGNLIKQTDSNGKEWKYSYDMLGRIKKATNPLEKTTSYFYDLDYNETWVYDAEGNHQVYAYDTLGQLTYVYGGREEDVEFINLAKFEYDELSRLKAETEYLDENKTNTAKYTYDAKNRIETSVLTGTSESGKEYNKYTYSYNDYEPNMLDGNVGSVTKTPANTNFAIIKNYYEINTGSLMMETVLSRTNTNLYTASYEYDYIGNILNAKQGSDYDANRYTVKTTYNYANQPTTQTNAEGKTLISRYDMAGRLCSNTNYMGDTTRYIFNTLGQNIKQIIPFEDNITVSLRSYYDSNGNVVRTETEKGELGATQKEFQITKYEYTADNALSKMIQNNGENLEETEYTYYNNGLAKTLSVGANSEVPETTTYEYNILNQLTKTIDAMGNEINITPYRTGAVKMATDRNGVLTEYEYNALGSPLSVIAKKDGEEEHINFTYDNMGNMDIMTDSEGTTNYDYDLFGRLMTETRGGVKNNYEYTKDGNLWKYKLINNGNMIQDMEYEYNTLRRLETAKSNNNTEMKASYTYYDDGNIWTETRGNNVVQAEYVYNKAGFLTGLTDGGNVYTYDHYADGNIKKITENGVQKSEYMYDGVGRLKNEITPEGTSAYQYDEYGNRKQKIQGEEVTKYTYDLNNRLITEDAQSGVELNTTNYSYDPNGNQLYKVKGKYMLGTEGDLSPVISIAGEEESNVEVYGYNLFGKLTNVSKDGKISIYTYDGTGLRQSKQVDGVKTNQIWSNGNIVAETDKDGNKIANYYLGLTLYGAEISGQVAYYSYNGHGDTTKLVGERGQELANYDYDAFGNQIESDQIYSEDNIYNPFRYAGEYYDNETELIYLRNRYYDTDSGRFTQEDPIKDGTNWYAYCVGNPVRYIDPWGLKIFIPEIQNKDDERFIYLQSLTDDELDFDPKTGEITYEKAENVKRDDGTDLVRDIIDGDIECNIRFNYADDDLYFLTMFIYDDSGTLLGADIYINPENKKKFWTYDEKEGFAYREGEKFIDLGHELIHVYNVMTGVVDDSYDYGGYFGGLEPGKTWLQYARREELNVTGIDYYEVNVTVTKEGKILNSVGGYVEASKNRYTENALREENNLARRKSYNE